jgi:uncharacterized membrane protein
MPRSTPSVYRRTGEELEFDRVAFFSDAIYAIAMTVIVVGIGAPVVKDATSSKSFLDALWAKNPEIVSFFLSFAVLGMFWSAHHEFVSRLAAIDTRLRTWNIVYLAFVAFLPFPALLLGQYPDNSAAVALYAVGVGAISGLETIIFRHAHRAGLNRKQMSPAIANYGTVASALPVVFFLLSAPIAFINPILGMATWALSLPAQAIHNRYAPEGADEFFA